MSKDMFGPDDLVGLKDFHHVLPIHRHTAYSWLTKGSLPPPDGEVRARRPARDGWRVSTIRKVYAQTHSLEDEQLPPCFLPDDELLPIKDFHLVVPIHERTAYTWVVREKLPEPDAVIAPGEVTLDAWKVSTLREWFDRRKATSSRRWRDDVVEAAIINRVEAVHDIYLLGAEHRIMGAVEGTSELIVRLVFQT